MFRNETLLKKVYLPNGNTLLDDRLIHGIKTNV